MEPGLQQLGKAFPANRGSAFQSDEQSLDPAREELMNKRTCCAALAAMLIGSATLAQAAFADQSAQLPHVLVEHGVGAGAFGKSDDQCES